MNRGLQNVYRIISKSSTPISFDEIFKLLGEDISKRTLHRKLARLVDYGEITRNGTGPGSRYSVADAVAKIVSNLVFSPEAAAIRDKTKAPLKDRKGALYNHDFLAVYEPNVSYYLSENSREELKKVGVQPNGKQPAGTFAKKLFNKLLIDLSWNSSRLEGNTYSLLETEKLLLGKNFGDEKTAMETQMILNHKAAIEFLVEGAEHIDFNRFTVLNLHGLLSKNLLGNPAASGRVRNIPVGIGGAAYEPINIQQLLEERLNDILAKASAIKDPFEQSFFVLVHIPYLQPFEDVNKRVSRLSSNIPLIKHNLCPLSFVDVSEQDYIDATLGVYELNETKLLEEVYVWAYRRSALRYSAIGHEVGEPGLFRMKFDQELGDVIKLVVMGKKSREEAPSFIRSWAQDNIPAESRMKFLDVAEEELLSIHIGNIASYKLTQNDFEDWKKVWG